MRPHRLLSIEDDADIARLLRLDLEDAGYEVTHADCGMQGLLASRQQSFDLILLDLGLPDFDGSEVLKRLRSNSEVPVIALSARDAVDEKVRLLELGANDYMVKPFSLEELLARVQVQLRSPSEEVLRAGPLELNLTKRTAACRDEDLRLTAVEFTILQALMSSPGKVFSRAELNQLVWEGQLNDGSNVLDVHVANIRSKLRDFDEHRIIRTVRGLGYSVRNEA